MAERRAFSLSTHTLKHAWRLNEDINTRTTSPELLWVTSWAFHQLIWVKAFHILISYRPCPKWNTSCAFVVLRTYNGHRVRVSVKSTRPWNVPFLILAFRRVLASAPFCGRYAPSIRTSARTGASSSADFYPTVKAALRHESADSEEDREGLGCHLGQGHTRRNVKVFTATRQNKRPTVQQTYLFSRMYILLLHFVLRNDNTTLPTCFNFNSKFHLFAKKVSFKKKIR